MMWTARRLAFLGVLILLAVGVSGCAWGGVSGIALLAALLLGLGAGCDNRSLGAEDDAGTGADASMTSDSGADVDAATTSCGQGTCPAYMSCVTLQQEPWCLPDVDGDGVPDGEDNCVWLANPDQVDTEADGWGDACDLYPEEDNNLSPCGWCAVDEDGDGIAGTLDDFYPGPMGDDNCPILYNPDQDDADGDGVGDACDLCPLEPNIMSPCGDPCLDSDGDGISDHGDCTGVESDECPGTPSASSGDHDGDSLPDVCDPDGIPPVAAAGPSRRQLLERLRSRGVLDAETTRIALRAVG